MINKDLQNNAEDEILSVGDVKIQQMIKNLHRVDAPKDFDFRLKARIANAKSTDFQPRFLPVLRYVLPLSVVVLIFTFVIINGIYFGGNNQTVAEVQPIPVETKLHRRTIPQVGSPEAAQIPAEIHAANRLAKFGSSRNSNQRKEKQFRWKKQNLSLAKSPKKAATEFAE